MKFKIKKHGLYYLVLVLAAIIILIANYPRLYGVDAFQVMWMAQALKEGALFSDNTWLISPFSYFGYYPFSFRAIGVPIFLAFLMTLLEFLSFGIFGIIEAILLYNFILILLIYKTSRTLGETLFQEEWSRIVFVAAILFSASIIIDYTMTVSTRIIITITMLILLNLMLKILEKGYKITFKTIFYIIVIIFIGALAHRLWMYLIITIIFVVFTLVIRKYNMIHHISVFLIIPIAIITFFFGFEFFGLEKYGYNASANILDLSLFFGQYYIFAIGLIIVFFPFGVLIATYKLTFSFEDFPVNISHRDKLYYLLLFLIPFFFFIFTTYYAIVIFLPIIIIFSVKGLVYIKEYLSKITLFSKKVDWILPIIIIFILSGYYLLRFDYYSKIAVMDIIFLIFISFGLFLTIFLFIKSNRINITLSGIDFSKLRTFLWLCLLSISVLASSLANVEIRKYSIIDNDYPWDNRYLTEEETLLIQFFHNEDISGLILVADRYIAERIAGVGFLPAISDSAFTGTPLFYGIISPYYVLTNTKFTIWNLLEFTFFNFTQIDPIKELRDNIKDLDLRVESDLDTFLSYHIQYIITINETYYSGGINTWLLIQSLTLSEEYEPIFSTLHLVVWKIF